MLVRFEEYDQTPLETLRVTARTADNRGAWLAVDAGTALFVPWNADWCVRFYSGDDDGLEVFAQAVKPVRISAELIELIGLDLGIEVVDGSVRLTGEDEFEWNQIAQEYPEELIRRARAGINDALERIMLATYPFDRSSAELVGEFGA
jgi:protein associated with RNAse G/E